MDMLVNKRTVCSRRPIKGYRRNKKLRSPAVKKRISRPFYSHGLGKTSIKNEALEYRVA